MHCVTHISLSDGFGSQFQHIISVLLICYRNGWTFVYNPITKMDHNYENDPNWLEKIENLMNIKNYFMHKTDPGLCDKVITECDMTAKYVIDKNIDEYTTDTHMNKIRDMFWANKERDVFKNGRVNVAIHIRRLNTHDLTLPYVEDCRVNTPNDYYLNVIQRIRNGNKGKDLLFHVYSQGDLENFECFKSEDTVLHINGDLCESFISMVASDILATSFSSLSYAAAFLNTGVIYYHPFWHPPKETWIVC